MGIRGASLRNDGDEEGSVRIPVLLAVPVLTYLSSYVYLAFYRRTPWLFHSIIHESGEYTLLESVFYVSHFLGHVPVVTFLALYFTGVTVSLIGPATGTHVRSWIPPAVGLLLLLASSVVLSFIAFGSDDTLGFLLQQKQSVVRYEQGGAWNLHFPSTISQLLLIPLTIILAGRSFGIAIQPDARGRRLVLISILFLFAFTWLVNANDLRVPLQIWSNPRYLAHSVRELLTFPLIFYPLSLYLFLKYSRPASTRTRFPLWAAPLAFLFIVLFTYQSVVSLQAGIGNLAQKPAFAQGGNLSIPYLLASHYFEHFLDTVYFFLLCWLFYSLIQARSKT
jgi:hypothetical protein